MHDLEITWPGGQARFSPKDSPILIGRSSSAAVVIPQGTVSRRHLVVIWDGRSWQAEDPSTHGSFDPIGVRLSSSWTVGSDVVVRLGSPVGAEVSMRLITTSAGPADLDPYADADAPPTIVDFGPPPPPDSPRAGVLAIPDQGGDQVLPMSSIVDADTPGQSVRLGELGEVDSAVADAPPAGQPMPTGHGLEGAPNAVVEPMAQGGVPVVNVAKPPSVVDHPISPTSAASVFDQPATAFDEEPLSIGDPGPDVNAAPAATFVENDTLRLQIDGEDFVFLPGHEVTVGRDPSCTVTVDERHSLVSRRHLRFVHAEGSWWLEDASSKGTYIHGRRLNRPYKTEGAFIAQLGDASAGTQLRIVTTGQHRQPTNRAGLAVGAVAAAALVLAAVVAWFVFRSDDSAAEALTTAKQSTVMLLSEAGHGSGFFVTQSVIVTNQHVAAMADQLVVAVSPEEDEPAEIQYVASLVENHPFLDIALVKITNRALVNDAGSVTVGQPVDAADVPILELGDSSSVTIGDSVISTGFPGVFSVSSSDDTGLVRLPPVSTTSGQAANFTSWPGCSTPNLADFIPADAPPTVTCSADGNIDKGVLLASFASGQGASGSAVLHEDRVVAVVFAGDSDDSTASRSITTNAFSRWLAESLAEVD